MTDSERERLETWKTIEQEIRVAADLLVYARQREWSGLLTMDRLRLRNLIAELAFEEAQVAVRRFEKLGRAALDAAREGE